MTIRAVVVDDEPLPRQRIIDLVTEQSDFELVGEVGDGRSALDLITALRPDVAFLDIQMPELDGFQVVASLDDELLPAIVFITAFDEHAVRAFDVSAVDYLLKPVSPARFAAAIERLRGRLLQTRAVRSAVIRSAVDEAASTAPRITRFVAFRGNKHYLIPVEEIDWIEADGNYLRLHTGVGSHLVRETMKNAAARLAPESFVRIHRSTIVAADQVASVEAREHGEHTITLRDGTRIDSSRAFAEHVRRLFR